MRRNRRPFVDAMRVLGVMVVMLAVTAGPARADNIQPNEGWGYRIMSQSALWYGCVGVDGESTRDLATTRLYNCGNGVSWHIQWLFERRTIVNGKQAWRIKNRNAEKCLDVRDASRASGAPFQIFSCHDNWNQLFWLVDDPTSRYDDVFIKPVYSFGEVACMTVHSPGDPVGPPDPIQQHDCSATPTGLHSFRLQPAV